MNGYSALALVISFAVAFIGFMQWRTAHQKVLLDLFERRFQVWDGVLSAVGEFLSTEGNEAHHRLRIELSRRRYEARFLFGDEVVDAIDAIHDDVTRYWVESMRLHRKNVTEAEQEERLRVLSELDRRLGSVTNRLTETMLPYLKMDQKRVRTLGEWFQDKNKQRLSYAYEEGSRCKP